VCLKSRFVVLVMIKKKTITLSDVLGAQMWMKKLLKRSQYLLILLLLKEI
jgi:hypothetical protein